MWQSLRYPNKCYNNFWMRYHFHRNNSANKTRAQNNVWLSVWPMSATHTDQCWFWSLKRTLTGDHRECLSNGYQNNNSDVVLIRGIDTFGQLVPREWSVIANSKQSVVMPLSHKWKLHFCTSIATQWKATQKPSKEYQRMKTLKIMSYFPTLLAQRDDK